MYFESGLFFDPLGKLCDCSIGLVRTCTALVRTLHLRGGVVPAFGYRTRASYVIRRNVTTRPTVTNCINPADLTALYGPLTIVVRAHLHFNSHYFLTSLPPADTPMTVINYARSKNRRPENPTERAAYRRAVRDGYSGQLESTWKPFLLLPSHPGRSYPDRGGPVVRDTY